MSDSIHLNQIVEKVIDRDIYANQTLLVYDLLLKNHPEFLDDIENYYDESSETVEYYLLHETEVKQSEWEQLDVHERLNLAVEKDFEPMPHEIHEWWLVSKWLADQLKQFEEPVLSNDYGNWWGRTCTGQAITLDDVIQKIIASNQ